MKKIMFNDKYGLTEAVLNGRKTQTRRIADQSLYYLLNLDAMTYKMETINSSRYKIGEVVAIAQKYSDIENMPFNREFEIERGGKISAGWDNKMFVEAIYMPHHIKITNVRVERLQDISDADCLAEGVTICETPICHKNYCTRDCDDCAVSPKEAYAILIDKVSKKGTWDLNPWVFVYEFELID